MKKIALLLVLLSLFCKIQAQGKYFKTSEQIKTYGQRVSSQGVTPPQIRANFYTDKAISFFNVNLWKGDQILSIKEIRVMPANDPSDWYYFVAVKTKLCSTPFYFTYDVGDSQYGEFFKYEEDFFPVEFNNHINEQKQALEKENKIQTDLDEITAKLVAELKPTMYAYIEDTVKPNIEIELAARMQNFIVLFPKDERQKLLNEVNNKIKLDGVYLGTISSENSPILSNSIYSDGRYDLRDLIKTGMEANHAKERFYLIWKSEYVQTNIDNVIKMAKRHIENFGNSYQNRISETDPTILRDSKEPSKFSLFYAGGTYYKNNKKYNEAIDNYLKAIEIQSDSYDCQYNLGMCYYYNSIQLFGKALEISDKAKQSMAMEELNNELAKATPFFAKARQLKPEVIEPNFSLFNVKADFFYQNNRYEEAIPYYLNALEIKPNDIVTLFNIGYCFLIKGDSLSNKAEGIDDNQQRREVLKLASPDYLKAVEYFEKARVIIPDEKNILANLSKLYLALVEMGDNKIDDYLMKFDEISKLLKEN